MLGGYVMELSNRNRMLDLLKGFACIGVVFIHVTFPGLVGKIFSKAGAFAVPIFFLIAGFYAFNKQEKTIKQRLLKIIKIFIFAYIIFALNDLLFVAKNENLLTWFSRNFNLITPIKYIVFCSIGFAIPLWYLIAQIETYIFWIYVIRKKKESLIIKFIPVLFVAQVLLTTLCETMGLSWSWKINFVTRSLVWFVSGYYIASLPKDKIQKINIWYLLFGMIMGLVIIFIPTFSKCYINFSCVGYIPLSISLFLIALRNPELSICRPIEFLGSTLSLWVYIFHVPVDSMLVLICKNIFAMNIEAAVFQWIKPVIVLIITIIFAFVFNLIIDKFINRKK